MAAQTLSEFAPVFTEIGEELLRQSRISSIYRSNNDGISESLSTLVANDSLSVGYEGSFNRSNSYIDGHGNKVRSTQYEVWNNAFTAAARGEDNLLTLKGSLQAIPYQGYVNQYMDMVENRGGSLNLENSTKFDWGNLDAQIFWQDTKHDMGFFSREKTGEMPMNTHGRDLGYSLKTEIPLDDKNTLRLGDELHSFNLDDSWPAVPGSMMMGPNTYININDGQRQLFDNYAEWEFKPAQAWTTLFGIRSSLVHSDAGDVQPYQSIDTGMMKMSSGMDMMGSKDIAAAEAFNASDRSINDNNLDVTARLSYEPTKVGSYEIGYARKTRSPNLYERYAWGRDNMSMAMIGWFGDANGYVGNLDLEPEIAHTVSASMTLNDKTEEIWQLQLTPYATYIEDYIDVDTIGSFHPGMKMSDTKALLQFANHDARIGGIDLSGSARIWDNESLGQGHVTGLSSWLRGERTDGTGSLYHMMPFNGRVALQQTKNAWSNSLELELVDDKSRVNEKRGELPTSRYATVNIFTSYKWEDLRIDLGVTNLFDKFYDLPLGGVDYADWKAEGGLGSMGSVAGIGRSFNAGITVDF